MVFIKISLKMVLPSLKFVFCQNQYEVQYCKQHFDGKSQAE